MYSQVDGLAYTTSVGATATALTKSDTRKAGVFSGTLYCTGPTYAFGGAPYLGIGVNIVGLQGLFKNPDERVVKKLVNLGVFPSSGAPPPTTANQLPVRITTDTRTDPLYPDASASPAAYAFHAGTDLLWVCDDGGSATAGVWAFAFDDGQRLYVPSSTADRVWSDGACSDIVGQVSRRLVL
jgi:hypothetical protein